MNPKDYWKVDDSWLDDLEWSKPWVKPKINIEYKPPLLTELKQRIAEFEEENRAVTKALEKADRTIVRLRAENERLKQELAEAKELSLF